MKEPCVKVGILSSKTVDICFNGLYSSGQEATVTCRQQLTISESGISMVWNGEKYTELMFSPSSYDGDTFELDDVTIGVDFHWERKERQRFRGSLRLVTSDGKIVAINILNVEDYLASVITSEMRGTSSMPLLRAHAIISRSWLLRQIEEKSSKKMVSTGLSSNSAENEIIRWWDHEDHTLFDVCADDHCQRYQGLFRTTNRNPEGAIKDTRGIVLMSGNDICDARFSKCCGGVFERYESCWDNTPHPYLVAGRDDIYSARIPVLTTNEAAGKWIMSKPSSFCDTQDERILSQVLNNYDLERKDYYRWTESYTQERIANLIHSRCGLDLGAVLDLIPLERGTSGRIIRLKIIGTKGEAVIGKELMIRRTLSETHLLSSAFVVKKHTIPDNSVPYAFTLYGAGWGHGVGLCQIGAAVMGEKGYSHDEILRHYYPNTRLVRLY